MQFTLSGMRFLLQNLRSPVKREHADSYLRWLVVSFALSVIGVRVWLELTGYPQIGNDTLHIAHVLWGGLLLFIGALLPLLFANRSALMASAVLAGIGMGQFIDEVGKFITRSNDYFYAPALPIIYGFFLLTVMLYLRIRRPAPSSSSTVKAELYAIFDSFEEVLENDLDAKELALLKRRLRGLRDRVEDANLQRLTMSLLSVLENRSLITVADTEDWVERLSHRVSLLEETVLIRPVLRLLLMGSYVVTGILAFQDALQVSWAFLSQSARTNFLERLIASGDVIAQQAFGWFVITTVLEGAIGVALFVSAVYLLTRHEVRALQLATFTLFLFLTTVNLLVFYFDQFQAILTSLFFFLLYVLSRRYHQRFLEEKEASRLLA